MIKEFRDRGFGGGRDRGRSGGFGGGRGGFGGGRGGGFSRGRDSGPREMFSATCSTCGKACQVPFKPTGSKPVLCSECFGKNDSGNRFDSGSSGSSKQFDQINAKLDKILAILSELELDVEEDGEFADEEELDQESEDQVEVDEDHVSEKMASVSTEDTEEEYQ